MPDTLREPEDFHGETSSSSEQNPGETRQQPYTPGNPNVDYGAPGVPRPAAGPHDTKYSPRTASLPSVWNQETLNQTAIKIGTLIGATMNIFKGVQRQLG